MSLGDVSLACACALVDVLVGAGMRHACVSPGSRSTPLALALARHPRVETHVHLDERSSAFFALGIAKATLRPVAVACTSGTAAAELFPAAVEASQSRMPLVLLTADRPPRLRGTGANQTIDQVELYGGYVRAYEEPPVPAEPEDAEAWRASAARALDGMRISPGPVHVNCPFEEPLSPSQIASSLRQTRQDPGDIEPPEPSVEEHTFGSDIKSFWNNAGLGSHVIIVAGSLPDTGFGGAAFLSEAVGWPLVAEPISGARVSGRRPLPQEPGAPPPGPLSAGQALLASSWLDDHVPDGVVQLGTTPTTRASLSLVRRAEHLIVVDADHPDADPEGAAELRIRAPADAFAYALATMNIERPRDLSWEREWFEADGIARSSMDAFMDRLDEPFEPRVARDLAAWIPEGGTLFVGNSSPIRDLDLAMRPRAGLRVMANRGASGIDGLVSTALGIAAVGPGPTVALLGDLSFLHDVGALVWNTHRGPDLILTVLNNGGGELFAQLPQRKLPEHEQLFLTPHGLDLGAVCAAVGVRHERVERSDDLIPALERARTNGGIAVVEAAIDVERQRRRRAELSSAIDAALTTGA